MISGVVGHAKPKPKRAAAERMIAPPAPEWTLPPGLEGITTRAFDLLAEAERPIEYVIDRLAEAADIILLSGQPKVAFKTMLAVKLVLARIMGGSWLGFDVVKDRKRRALFLSAETRGVVLTRRLVKLCEAQGLDPAVAAKFIHIIDEPITLVSSEQQDRVRAKARLEAQLTAVKIHDAERRKHVERGADNLADRRIAALGQNVDLLDAIATPDTWSVIVIDTLRQHMAGKENESDDVANFTKAARELARACGCPVLIIHHSKKGADQSSAESSRGSGEIIGAPDVLINIDASGKYPTAHFLCRNHESPPPVGYDFKVDGGAIRFDVLPPCAGRSNGIGADEVLRVFEAHRHDGLTFNKIRELVAASKGAKPGSKSNAKTIEKQIEALLAQGAISECVIEMKAGRAFGKKTEPMKGYRLGTAGGTVPATKIDGTSDGEIAGVGGADDR